MSDNARCPLCGEPRPAASAQGECPHCQAKTLGEPSGASSLALEKTLAMDEPGGAASDATQCFEGASDQLTFAVGSLETLVQSMGEVPQVQLRDVASEPLTPVRPSPTGEVREVRSASNRYQVHGEIARGGMGAVLKGRDADLGRDLAIKVLLEVHRDKPELVHRFIEEAQISGQLQHPGVVPVYELGAFEDRRPYFTMKLVKGRTLTALIEDRANPADDLPRMLGIFEQICQTMAYAHARGVIHRDLKPSNIMVGAFGEVQVMDWGLAKVLKLDGGGSDDPGASAAAAPVSIIQTVRSGSNVDVSQFGSVLGTPAYMPPEQARGHIDELDERCDVFGLGAILCEILTGAPPYLGETHKEVLRQAARHEIAGALERLDQCSADAELVALAKRCLAYDPSDRPRQAGDLADALSNYMAGVRERLRAAELARVEAQANAAHERTKRRLTLVTATGFFALVILGGTAAFRLFQVRQAKRNEAELLLKEQHLLYEQAALDPRGYVPKWVKVFKAAVDAEKTLLSVDDSKIRNDAQALRKLIDQGMGEASQDHSLLDRLVKIRATQQGDEDMDSLVTTASYADAFRKRGLDLEKMSIDEAAAQIKARPPQLAIEEAAILDDWAALLRVSGRQPEVAQKLLNLAQRIDPDPWRSRLRSILALKSPDQQVERLIAFTSEALADLEGLREQPVQGPILLAYALESFGDRASALTVLRNAQRGHPGDVWVNLKLAATLSRAQPAYPEETVRYYSIAQALNPATAFGLAQYYHILQNRNEGAIEVFEDLIRLQPEEALYHLQLGLALRGMDTERAAKEFGLAVNYSRKAAQARPEIAWVYHTVLGTALVQLHMNDEAAAAYKEAMRLRPDYATAYNDLGIIEVEKGNLDAAIDLYRRAIRLRPDYIYAYADLCIACCQKGDYDSALSALEALYPVAPGSPRVSESLAMVADRLAEWYRWDDVSDLLVKAVPGLADNGVRRFQNALMLLLTQPDPQAYRRACAAFWNDHSQTVNPALAHYLLRACVVGADSGVELAPLLATSARGMEQYPLRPAVLALAYYRAGQFEEAIRRAEAELVKANSLARRFAVPVLAMAHARLGHAEDAQKWLEQTRDIDATRLSSWFDQVEFWLLKREAHELIAGKPAPEEPEITFGRAQTLYRTGHRSQADALLDSVIAAHPDDVRLLLAGADIFRRCGRPERVRADCLKALELAGDDARKLQTAVDMLGGWRHWEETAAALERLLKIHDNLWDSVRLAPVLIELGQEEKYRALRAHVIETFGSTNDPIAAERIAKMSILLPATGDTLTRASALSQQAIDKGTASPYRNWFELCRGLVAYRSGDYAGAVDWAQQSMRHLGQPINAAIEATDTILIAMASYQQGKHAEARQLLERSKARLRGRPPAGSPALTGGAWYDLLVTEILAKEATRLIEQPAATSAKSKKPEP